MSSFELNDQSSPSLIACHAGDVEAAAADTVVSIEGSVNVACEDSGGPLTGGLVEDHEDSSPRHASYHFKRLGHQEDDSGAAKRNRDSSDDVDEMKQSEALCANDSGIGMSDRQYE